MKKEKDWSNKKYLLMAKREPKRLEFWRRYCKTELQAARAVCDNSPSFDNQWQQVFPDSNKYKREMYANDCM